MTIYLLITIVFAWIGYLLAQHQQIVTAFTIAVSAILPLVQPQHDVSSPSLLARLRQAINSINGSIARQPYFYIGLAALAGGVLVTSSPQWQLRSTPKALDYLTYIVDNSGSMGRSGEIINNKTKVEYAIDHIRSEVNTLTEFGQLGLVVIGGDSGESSAGECKVSSLIDDRTTQALFLQTLDQIRPNYSGATDITGAIATAVEDIAQQEYATQRGKQKRVGSKQIVVISDLGHNCKNSKGLETINNSITKAIESGYRSSRNHPIRSDDAKEFIKGIVVFSLRSNSESSTVTSAMSPLLSQQALASPRTGLALPVPSLATDAETPYQRDVRLLRDQGILVKELSLDEFSRNTELSIPNQSIKRLNSGLLLALLFWSSYLIWLYLIPRFRSAFERVLNVDRVPMGDKMPHVDIKPNETKRGIRDNSNSYTRARVSFGSDGQPDHTNSGQPTNATTGEVSRSKRPDRSEDPASEKGNNSAKTTVIDITLKWNWHRDGNLLRLHIGWRENTSTNWNWLHNSFHQDVQRSGNFSISRVDYIEQGGPITLHIAGELNGYFWIIGENFDQSNPPNAAFTATPLRQQNAIIEITHKRSAYRKQIRERYHYPQNGDPSLACWDVCMIDCSQSVPKFLPRGGAVQCPVFS